MKGLLLRLSALEADRVEAALRVIAYFDALTEHRAGAHELVRATAALAECPAGLARPGTADVRVVPGGAAPAPPASATPSSAQELPFGGRVWLERSDGPHEFDDLVLERLAIAAGHLQNGTAPQLSDPALVELVLSARETAEDRARALRLLGLDPAAPVRVVAVAAADHRKAAAAVVGGAFPVRVAVVDHLGALIVRKGQHLEPVAGARVGVGGVVDGEAARESWLQARTAVRFAVAERPGESVVRHADLGGAALLAELPAERLRREPDVAALLALGSTDSGRHAVAALDAFCRTGTLRSAAAALHLHLHRRRPARDRRDGAGLPARRPGGSVPRPSRGARSAVGGDSRLRRAGGPAVGVPGFRPGPRPSL